MKNETPVVTQGHIASSLQELGLTDGASVLVHSSLSSFGYVEGGANAVIDALLQVVGPKGNIVVPTLTGTAEHGPDNPPIFDVRTSPCWTGRIPSVFMARPQALRSLHPTHSVAGIGPEIPWLNEGHEDAPTPCGAGTPYSKLAELDSYILLLGVGQGRNTTLHGAESLADVGYHMQPEPTDTVIIDHEGKRHVKRLCLHKWGTPRDFVKIDEPLTEMGIMRMGTIGKATVRLIRTQAMLDWLVPLLRKEKHYLRK